MRLFSGVATLLVCFIVMHVSVYAEDKTADELIATYMTGESLTRDCRAFLEFRRYGGRVSPQQGFDAALCLGYVEGVFDTVNVENLFNRTLLEIPRICLPANQNANSLAEIVATFLDQNPALRTQTAYLLVMRAFANSFPCQK